jgi:hypothetical protein
MIRNDDGIRRTAADSIELGETADERQQVRASVRSIDGLYLVLCENIEPGW